MKIGIHFDYGKSMSPFSQVYEQILTFNKIEIERMHIDDADFWKKLNSCDYFIFRWGHSHSTSQLAKSILPIIEREMGIKVFPDQKTCWHYDDKIIQYYLLKVFGYPIITSWIFWNEADAINWVKKDEFPLIMKLKRGAGSSNVLLAENEKQAIHFIKKLFDKGILSVEFNLNKSVLLKRKVGKILRNKNILNSISDDFWEIEKDYVLFQKYLPGNEYDTRITVIGGRAFAFRRMNRINDFRASGSGLLDHDSRKIDPNLLNKAFEISNKLEFKSMAYDFIYDELKQPAICEISYTFSDAAVYKCPGFWDEQLNWNEGHYLPQYFQLMDFLNKPDLKKPTL